MGSGLDGAGEETHWKRRIDELRVADYEFRVTSCELRVTGYKHASCHESIS